MITNNDKDSLQWRQLFENEIAQAESARSAGNEGMARVCARRAAGIVIGEYIRRLGIPDPGPSAYDRLRYLSGISEQTPEIHIIVNHFLVNITPDRNLPVDADLIAEARWLDNKLLNE